MADNNFRGYQSRDPIAREDVDLTAGDFGDNPLADLARLIGQRDRVNEFDRGARHGGGAVETLEQPAPPADGSWAADERYAEPNAPAQYAEEDDPSDPAYAEYDHDAGPEPAPAARYAEPADQYDDPHDARADARAQEPRYRDDERSHAPQYREEDAPPRAVGRQFPPLAPQSHDDEYDEQLDDHGYDQSDIPEEYEDDSAGTPRRRGLAIVLAMVGLVLIGAAGAFAYRSMFGGAMLVPSLPPVIKPADGPNKIVPNPAASGSPNAAAANPSAPAQLMPREEQPAQVQPPPAPPKVLSQIPVPAAPTAPAAVTPAPDAPPPVSPVPALPKATAPGQPQATAPTSTEPKRIHTIAIPSDQVGDNAAAAPPPVAPAPSARPRTTEPVTRPSAAPRGPNAPLSLVPGAQARAPAAEPPRSRAAVRAEPPPSAPVATAPAAPAPSAGGYAVQVTSQRSEAEAQTAFRELQAKFPGQLGNRQPIIHRADLADKGTYYRAMVGPFGSAEAAASLCSNLKAAGGSCIVQKN